MHWDMSGLLCPQLINIMYIIVINQGTIRFYAISYTGAMFLYLTFIQMHHVTDIAINDVLTAGVTNEIKTKKTNRIMDVK